MCIRDRKVPQPESQKLIPRAPDFEPPLPLWNGSRSQGPLVGHVSDDSAILWARVPVPGTYTLEVTDSGGANAKRSFHAVARESDDWCLRWEVSELKANSTYHYRIARAAEILWEGRDFTFKTAPKTDDSVEVTLAFGSCANFESSSIWTRIKTEGADGVVLLGDTPYIDVTDLDRVHDAYRRFSSIPTLSATFRSIPFWANGHDNVFALTNTPATLRVKKKARDG